MEKIRLNYKKLCEQASAPVYGTPYAAGADLRACVFENGQAGSINIEPGEAKLVHTGISLEIPEGMVGLVYARSGLATKQGLAPANKVGVIDSDYRGEIMVSLYNQSGDIRTVNHGDRIAQIVVTPYISCDFVETDELSDTVRGASGFGSTGIK